MKSSKINPNNKPSGKVKILETKALNASKYSMNNPTFKNKTRPTSTKKKVNIFNA